MKLSYTTLAIPGRSCEEAAVLARRYGFDGVDFRVTEKRGDVWLDTPDSRFREIVGALKGEGVVCSSVLCYNPIGSDEASSWQTMEQSLLRHIEIAEKLNSDVIRVFTGNPQKRADSADFCKRTAETLARVADKSGSGVRLLIQNHRLNSSVGDTVSMLDTAAHPKLGMIFSPDHCLIIGEDVEKACDAAKQYADRMYLADIKLVPDGFEEILPGNGDVPLIPLYHRLSEGANIEWLTFKWEKMWYPHIAEAEVAMPYFVDYVKSHGII